MSVVSLLSSLLLLAAAPPQAVGPVETDAKTIAIAGTEHNETLPCNGRAVSIEGVDHVITLTGVCKSVQITGSGNTVTVAIAPGGLLSVAGTDQTVRWRSTGEVRRSVTGVDNKVVRER